ncbi:MAG TPA: flavodoxin domain-containing protein, partial [Gammaproteobacteria bacterium]|nr:flavodoxin domain-containing protein [Gammaproteobacteria bacterium]
MSARISLPSQSLPAQPLSAEKSTALKQLVKGLDSHALSWVAGYTAALAFANNADEIPEPTATKSEAGATLTILYGSQTGNARRLAEDCSQQAQNNGLPVSLKSTADYNPRNLKKERTLLVVISTQGDGEAPDDALGFIDFINSKRAPALPELHYAVLALGDSSYPDFCSIGKHVDARLASLGATRLHERGDCDLDIETIAEPWWKSTFEASRKRLANEHGSATITPLRAVTSAAYDRNKPFAAPLLTRQRITSRDTNKDIHH